MKEINTKFKAGNPGKPKGAVNKVNTEIRNKISKFLETNWATIEQDFLNIDPKDRMVFYEKLLQYALPKLQSVAYKDEMESLIDRLTPEQIEQVINELKSQI